MKKWTIRLTVALLVATGAGLGFVGGRATAQDDDFTAWRTRYLDALRTRTNSIDEAKVTEARQFLFDALSDAVGDKRKTAYLAGADGGLPVVSDALTLQRLQVLQNQRIIELLEARK